MRGERGSGWIYIGEGSRVREREVERASARASPWRSVVSTTVGREWWRRADVSPRTSSTGPSADVGEGL